MSPQLLLLSFPLRPSLKSACRHSRCLRIWCPGASACAAPLLGTTIACLPVTSHQTPQLHHIAEALCTPGPVLRLCEYDISTCFPPCKPLGDRAWPLSAHHTFHLDALWLGATSQVGQPFTQQVLRARLCVTCCGYETPVWLCGHMPLPTFRHTLLPCSPRQHLFSFLLTWFLTITLGPG